MLENHRGMNSLPRAHRRSQQRSGHVGFRGDRVALNSLAISLARSKTPRSAIRAWSLLTLTQNESAESLEVLRSIGGLSGDLVPRLMLTGTPKRTLASSLSTV